MSTRAPGIRQGRPTLLVAITDKDAGDEMKRWFDAADAHAPASVQRESIISIHTPFFVGLGTVRDRVQPRVPEQYWGDTLVDRDGGMAKTLGLDSSHEPYIFALERAARCWRSCMARRIRLTRRASGPHSTARRPPRTHPRSQPHTYPARNQK